MSEGIRLTAHIPDTVELAERRAEAGKHLVRYHQSGNDRYLAWFVSLVGDGGTFPSDFPVIPEEPTGGRYSLRPQCWRCRQRKAWSSFMLTPREWAERKDRIRHHLPVEELWHGHSGWCHSCRIERADNRPGRTWYRMPTERHGKIIAIDAPVTLMKVCECCGDEYETVHADQRYCSKTCRERAKKRRYRDREVA